MKMNGGFPMDISSLLNTFLSSDSVSQLSQSANVSADEAKSVLSSALPQLLNGALSQSKDSETAEGFANALSQHASSDISNIGSFLSGVDLDDGSKIVSHLLGSGASAAVSEASQKAGVSEEKTSTILSSVAPLLMSLLGQETSSQQSADSSLDISGILGSLMGNTDLSGMLSGLLGGGSADSSSSSGKTGGLLDTLLGFLK